jgi:hypothetical protein
LDGRVGCGAVVEKYEYVENLRDKRRVSLLLVCIFLVWIVALKKSGESKPVAVSDARADREILISFLRRLTRQR